MLGAIGPLEIGTLIVSILIGMVVHESMHAYVGLKLGDDTAAEEGRISLNPLRHIDPLTTVALPIITLLLFHSPILAAKPVPFNPARVKFEEFGAALIAFAGPLSNLVLAAIAAIAIRFSGGDSTITQILSIFAMLNVGLFVFNLVPIPPLDGSRVLYAFAPDVIRRLFEAVEPFGIMIVFALVLLGGFGGLLLDINQSILSLLLP